MSKVLSSRRFKLRDRHQPAARIPVPDLLHPRARLGLDGKALDELLEISFLGGDRAGHLERALETPLLETSDWRPELFRDELFLDDLIADCFRVEVAGKAIPVTKAYLRGVMSRPPGDEAAVVFRQEILGELERSSELRDRAQNLFEQLYYLLSLFKAPDRRAKLDITVFRLEILEQARKLVALMDEDFAEARSGLRRLHDSARAIGETEEYRLLEALLDYENHLATLGFRVRVGADGRIRQLDLTEIEENVKNPFYRRPWRRLRDRIEMTRRGIEFTNRELVNRVVHEVFLRISDWLKPLLELVGQLYFYLGALGFRRRCLEAGLEMSLPAVDPGSRLELSGLFNPLLFRLGTPVPCDIGTGSGDSIVVVTGPNSGGKTRLLQAIGIAQVLGQSGLYVPAASARIPLVAGLFASTTERASVDQREGRLGTELLRIRRLFEAVDDRSMVIIDELCSGTNPSEAEEIFLLVLELLDRVKPMAFVTTHFLDFARQLERDHPVSTLEFLQVEMREDRSTFQFIPGVATTSLAASTARRLGVTFEELSGLIENRSPVDRSKKVTVP